MSSRKPKTFFALVLSAPAGSMSARHRWKGKILEFKKITYTDNRYESLQLKRSADPFTHYDSNWGWDSKELRPIKLSREEFNSLWGIVEEEPLPKAVEDVFKSFACADRDEVRKLLVAVDKTYTRKR